MAGWKDLTKRMIMDFQPFLVDTFYATTMTDFSIWVGELNFGLPVNIIFITHSH